MDLVSSAFWVSLSSLDNLVTLCHHHRALHRGEFTVETAGRGPELVLILRNVKGLRLRESIFPQFPDVSADTFPRKLAELAPAVTASTCSPH